MIDISQEDFGTLCICALRYCHGRQTYMPSLVQEIVQNHFKDLSEKDLKIIAEDERFQREMNLWSSKIDRLDWDNFYFALNEFRQTKPLFDKGINVPSKNEPQKCSVNGRPYSECFSCEHFRCTADEPQVLNK